jgi:hypothetical protein
MAFGKHKFYINWLPASISHNLNSIHVCNYHVQCLVPPLKQDSATQPQIKKKIISPDEDQKQGWVSQTEETANQQ